MVALSITPDLALDSYSELVQALNDWLDRDDLSGNAQAMISLAEARMRRRLTPLFLETSADLTSSDGIASLPSDYSTLTRVLYDGQPIPEIGVRSKTMISEGSEPIAYTIERNGIRLWPACDVTITVLYQPTIAQLTDATPTNTLLTQHPDLYFFGAMMFAEGYVANDNRAAVFKALFDEALEEVANHLTRQKFGGPLVPTVGFVP